MEPEGACADHHRPEACAAHPMYHWGTTKTKVWVHRDLVRARNVHPMPVDSSVRLEFFTYGSWRTE